MKAVIPAAGLGTRFLPATKAQPKEMLPLVDKPAIQYVVEECVESGIDDILIITGRGKRAIEDHFDHSIKLEAALSEKKPKLLREVQEISDLADIHYVRQKKPLGLGHAISCAKKHVDGQPFCVLLGDDIIYSKTPAIKQCMKVHEETGGSVIACEHVPPERIRQYGIVDVEEGEGSYHRIKDLVEKPSKEEAPSDIGIVGRYLLDAAIFDEIKKTGKGHGGEIQLTDALKSLNQEKDIYSLLFEGKRYDLGTKFDFLKASVEFALRREDFGEEFRKYLEEILK